MRRPATAAILLASIVVFPAAVKTRAADLPNVSQAARKADLKDSVKDTKNEFKQIVDFMMRNGIDGHYGENLAPAVGLPGARPVKGDNIRSKKFDKKRGGLNCSVVYEESPEATEYGGKRPICIFLSTAKLSGQESEGRYYKLSLDGHLERVALVRDKRDENGKGVRGSAVWTDVDVNSPEVKKAFAAEMADVRQWLKQQKKVIAKKATASTAKSGTPAATGAAASQANP